MQKVAIFFKCTMHHKYNKVYKETKKVPQEKDQNKPSKTNPKEIDTCELSENKYKIIMLKMLNVLQEKTRHTTKWNQENSA